MSIVPIRPATSALSGVQSLGSPSQSAGGGGFDKIVNQLLGDVGKRQTQSDLAIQDLAMGKTDNLHNVMLSVAKADLSFRMFLEIRNRLTEAYQEVMRMQV